ncbi:MAG TPA: ATP-grasp domain-containing protein [Streptosporangiaceae bacterium]|nr:ATP-grasp domain-containing protein [Streptosporangiaceae bacterium]
MPHILFVGVTRWSHERCARAVALGHRVTVIKPGPVRAAGQHGGAPASRSCATVHDSQVVPPGWGLRALTIAMADIHAAAPVDAVLVSDEAAIEATATACEVLGIPFTTADGVRNARNKVRTRRTLAAAGLASVRYKWAADPPAAVAAAQRIGYPVVVKPVRGGDSRLTSRADSAAAVWATARRIARYKPSAILVERHVSGRLLWVDIARASGQSRVVAVFDRCATDVDECRDIGAVLPARIEPAELARCQAYADSVCAALGLDLGLFHLDLALTAAGPVLIEANPRMMGGVLPLLYRFATGADIADVAIPVHLGAAPPPAAEPCHAAARKVMARDGGRTATHVNTAGLARAVGADQFVNYAIRPGGWLQRGHVAAVILAAADSSASAAADAALARLAELIGVDLVRASPG